MKCMEQCKETPTIFFLFLTDLTGSKLNCLQGSEFLEV